MSVIIEPVEVASHVEGRSDAYVMSVGESGKVKVMHAGVNLLPEGPPDSVSVELGPGGVRNCNARPAVTLLWPDVSEGMSLLADGTAETAEVPENGRTWVTIKITDAVLHKAPS